MGYRGRASVWTILIVAFAAGCTPLPVVDKPLEGQDFPFGKIDTYAVVKDKFKSFHLLYANEAMSKRTQNQFLSETGFYAGVLGVLGGIAKDIHAVAAGALVGAGAGLVNDRYGLQIQAHNYELAADAMLCMYRASQDIQGDNDYRDVALDGFFAVRGKLMRLQATHELGKPDPNKLKEAIEKKAILAANAARLIASVVDVAKYKASIEECVSKMSG